MQSAFFGLQKVPKQMRHLGKGSRPFSPFPTLFLNVKNQAFLMDVLSLKKILGFSLSSTK
jgi:hypothetical protein